MDERTTELGIARKATALVLLGVVATLLALSIMVGAPKPAHALCASPPQEAQAMEGTWVNADPNARNTAGAITRIEIRFFCGDQAGQPPTGFYVRVFSKCHQASSIQCDWGERVANYDGKFHASYARGAYNAALDIGPASSGQLPVSTKVSFDDHPPAAPGSQPTYTVNDSFKRQTYRASAVGGFSATQNPSGAWSYGYRASGGSGFTRYTNHRTFPDCASFDQWYVDADGVRGEPEVSHNHTGQTVSCLTIIHPPDVLNLHPGPAGQKSVVRWTAPFSGTVRIEGRFQGIDTRGTTTDVAVVQNSATTLFGRNINGYDEQAPFSITKWVNAGDTIDFSVGYGSNANYFYDSTGLSVSIT
jgi:hypothetical protein